MHELRHDVAEIKAMVGELVKQGAIHNHILNEHHKRSTLLEERVQPLEQDLVFRRKLYALAMGSSGLLAIGALVVSILALLKKG